MQIIEALLYIQNCGLFTFNEPDLVQEKTSWADFCHKNRHNTGENQI